MHLADAFIQSDLHCIQVTVLHFYQLLLSLGIEPMILALLAPCSTIWATGKLYNGHHFFYAILPFWILFTNRARAGACTMIVDEQIQSYRISFELTKPNHSNLALLVPWSWSSTFFVNSGLILS